jgi:hypothetical protein
MESLSDDTGETKERRRVGLVYDKRMCKHSTPKKEHHPENPRRIRAVWDKLVSAGIPKRFIFYYFYLVLHKVINSARCGAASDGPTKMDVVVNFYFIIFFFIIIFFLQ